MNSVYGKYFIKMALIWMICFVLFFLIHSLVLAPQKKSREQLEKKLAENKKVYDSALKAAEKETIIQLKEQIEYLRTRLKDFVIDFEDSTNLTFDISQIANGKDVSSFSIETTKGGGGSKSGGHISEDRIAISFTTGDFNQFATLLNDLERHQPVIFVDRFTINRSKRSGTKHKVKMDLAVLIRSMQDS